MSASGEELLQQINELELKIQNESKSGKNTTSLKEELLFLKEQLQTMNENLKKSDKILKG